MKILVASAFSADSRYAHAINTIKMADGFAKLGHDVTLVCRRPRERPLEGARLRESFCLSEALNVVQVPPTLMGKPLNAHGHFALQVAAVTLRLKPDLAYCRSYAAPALLARFGIPTVAESHAHPGHESAPFRRMVQAAARREAFRAVTTIAPVLKENFAALGVPGHKIHVLADAVDLDLFQRPPSYERTERSRPRIVYAGHLYDYKGIPTAIEAAAILPHCDFILIGGTDADIARVTGTVASKGLTNVRLLGLLPLSAVPPHLWDADVLLLPPSAKHPSAQWTSPVKLGEYLASGTPVVATRIPALEYWLTGDEVAFAEPDNAEDLAARIDRVLNDSDYAAALTERGRTFARTISYQERCRRVLDAC